jgi:hypothetical protein
VQGGSGKGAVVYLGHVPFGFFEKQLESFFTQFGDINRLRLSRSKKTTNSRGYAFIEFKDKDVADIVADTMNNYPMYGRVLRAEVMKPEKVHPEMFKNAGRRMKRVPRAKLNAIRHNKARTDEEVVKVQANLKASDSKKRSQLAALGIEYDFPGYGGDSGAAAAPAKKKAKTSVAAEVTTPAKKMVKATSKTPAKAAKTPAKAAATPKATKTPAKATKTPAKAAATPKATKTPAKETKTPAKTTKTPAKETKTLAKAAKTPAKAAKTPAKAAATPKVAKTPAMAAGKTPAKAAKTPKSTKKSKASA